VEAKLDSLWQIDETVFAAINGFAGQSALRDMAMIEVSHNYLLKGLVPVTVLWFLWFLAGPAEDRKLAGTLAVALMACVAIAIGRGLVYVLPMRARPIHEEALAGTIRLPHGLDPASFGGLSAMPSDHAVMFFALAAGAFAVNRVAGTILLLHAFFVVSLPRVYLGLHWPTDILVGMAVGLVVAIALTRPITWLLLPWAARDYAPGVRAALHALAFLAAVQLATMFDSLRALAFFVAKNFL